MSLIEIISVKIRGLNPYCLHSYLSNKMLNIKSSLFGSKFSFPVKVTISTNLSFFKIKDPILFIISKYFQ